MNPLLDIFSEKYQVWQVDTDLFREGSFMAGTFIRKKGVLRNERLFPVTHPDKENKSIPLVIVFTGKQIITRYEQTTRENLFGEIDLDDFYTDLVISGNGLSIHSIVRKSLVNDILGSLAGKGFFPVGFSLSCNCLFSLEGIVEQLVVAHSGLQFKFSDYHISGISGTEAGNTEAVTINGEVYSHETNLLPCALVSHLRGRSLKSTHTVNSEIQHKYFKLTRRFALIALATLLMVSSLNYFFYSYISEGINTLKLQHLGIETSLQQIEALEKQISDFEMLSANYMKSNLIPHAYYADRIASLKPAGMWFNSLSIHPFSRKAENNRPVETNMNTIRVSGEVRNPQVFNQFISLVRKEHWVKEIRIKNYLVITGENYALFEIDIQK